MPLRRGHYRDALPGLQVLAHHGQFLFDAPTATPLLAEHFGGYVFAGSHKRSCLRISYGKGGTVSCVSRGSFNSAWVAKVEVIKARFPLPSPLPE